MQTSSRPTSPFHFTLHGREEVYPWIVDAELLEIKHSFGLLFTEELMFS